MPALLLIGIPIAVVVLLIGIMSLPDEDVKDDEMLTEETPTPVKKKAKKKK